jgi:hypothetical protein
MTKYIQYESIEDWKAAVQKSSQILLHDTLKFSEPGKDGVVSVAKTIWDGRCIFLGAYSTSDTQGFKKNQGWFYP